MTTMSGKEALMTLLRNEGVEYVFGIPGATEIQFMDALEDAPDIQYILGLNEIVCAGWQKATHGLQVSLIFLICIPIRERRLLYV